MISSNSLNYCFLTSVFSLRSSPMDDILCLWHWAYIYICVNFIEFGDSIYCYRISNIFWCSNIINGCCYFIIWDIKFRNSFGFFASYRTHEQKQRCDIERETLLFMLQTMVFLSFISSVQFSRSVVSDSLRPHESQHARPPCPSPTPGVHSDSRPLSQWCYPSISSSVIPFSSCPNPSQSQSFFQWVNSLHEVAKVLEFQL